MSTTAAKKPNGRTQRAVCVHSPGCPVVDSVKDLLAVVQADQAETRRELREHRTLLESALMQMQERIDHLHAVLIDENEKTRATVLALGHEVRALGALVQEG